MNFAHPYYFLFAIPLLITWIMQYFRLGKKPELFLSKRKWKKGSSFTRILIFIVGIIGISLIAYSLTQPRKAIGSTKRNIKVNDIFFVVDVSKSMHAEDFPPNRLEVAKEKIRDFVSLRPTDRIGIIMFSEKAFTLLPLSTDLELIKQIISEIQVGFLGTGTNIGDALALAVGRGAQSLADNKIIILLTDGVSNVGSMTPIQAAEEAKAQEMKVYTIGIGKRSNKRVLKFGSAGYQRIPGGSVDTDTLEKISKITGGQSFYAGDAEALSQVLNEIQKLEKTQIQASSRVLYEELYWKYLLYGVILFMLAEVLRRILLREAF